jgi:hypothetical protein
MAQRLRNDLRVDRLLRDRTAGSDRPTIIIGAIPIFRQRRSS